MDMSGYDIDISGLVRQFKICKLDNNWEDTTDTELWSSVPHLGRRGGDVARTRERLHLSHSREFRQRGNRGTNKKVNADEIARRRRVKYGGESSSKRSRRLRPDESDLGYTSYHAPRPRRREPWKVKSSKKKHVQHSSKSTDIPQKSVNKLVRNFKNSGRVPDPEEVSTWIDMLRPDQISPKVLARIKSSLLLQCGDVETNPGWVDSRNQPVSNLLVGKQVGEDYISVRSGMVVNAPEESCQLQCSRACHKLSITDVFIHECDDGCLRCSCRECGALVYFNPYRMVGHHPLNEVAPACLSVTFEGKNFKLGTAYRADKVNGKFAELVKKGKNVRGHFLPDQLDETGWGSIADVDRFMGTAPPPSPTQTSTNSDNAGDDAPLQLESPPSPPEGLKPKADAETPCAGILRGYKPTSKECRHVARMRLPTHAIPIWHSCQYRTVPYDNDRRPVSMRNVEITKEAYEAGCITTTYLKVDYTWARVWFSLIFTKLVALVLMSQHTYSFMARILRMENVAYFSVSALIDFFLQDFDGTMLEPYVPVIRPIVKSIFRVTTHFHIWMSQLGIIVEQTPQSTTHIFIMGVLEYITYLPVLYMLAVGALVLSCLWTRLRQRRVEFIPHMVTCVLSEYERGVNAVTLQASVRQNIRRLATMPVIDEHYVPLATGSELIVEAVAARQPYFTDGATQTELFETSITPRAKYLPLVLVSASLALIMSVKLAIMRANF